MVNFIQSLIRRKPLETSVIHNSPLNRCLSTFHLTIFGIGSTLGLGVYVLAGQVAASKAGPSVTLSFFIAGLAAVFSGLCYAEFGARVPKAGSAYVYSYVTVGEFLAFIIGWNLILEYLIGTAAVARGYSGYMDALLGGKLSSAFHEWVPIDFPEFDCSKYFDLLAFGIPILLAAFMCFGVKESTNLNTIFTLINLLGVFYAIICGSFAISDFRNWGLSKDEVKDPLICPRKEDGEPRGEGGFFAYGYSGMMAGAATCFYGFVGFDAIATTGEEVKNPAKSIPRSIILSLFFIFLSYCGVSTVQTLMWPYCDQDRTAPLPYVFDSVGYPIAGYILTAGALAGLYATLLGAMFPLTRVIYAMARDGVIFRAFSNVNEKFKTPLLATMLSGVFAGVLAAVFTFQQLCDMMSIGTLLAYTLVSASVVILRYRDDPDEIPAGPVDPVVSFARSVFGSPRHPPPPSPVPTSTSFPRDNSILTTDSGIDENPGSIIFPTSPMHNDRDLILPDDEVSSSPIWSSIKELFHLLFNTRGHYIPNASTRKTSNFLIGLIILLIVGLDLTLVLCEKALIHLKIYPFAIIGTLVSLITLSMIALKRQPQTRHKLAFQVPFLPVLPFLSVFANVYLMLKLSPLTWYRFAIWMICGFLMYFLYGIRKSTGFLSDSHHDMTTSNSAHAPSPVIPATPKSKFTGQGSINRSDSNLGSIQSSSRPYKIGRHPSGASNSSSTSSNLGSSLVDNSSRGFPSQFGSAMTASQRIAIIS